MGDEKKYQVFISSTFKDLQAERRAVQDHLLSQKYVPVGMETFLGSHKVLPEYLTDLIDACDYYVVIVAGRYGNTNKEGKSWTEQEYDYAASKDDLPILAFFKDSEQDYSEQIKKFREKIEERCVPTRWTNEDNLAAKVFRKLTETETNRPGWVRADQLSVDMETAQQLREAEKELVLTIRARNALQDEIGQLKKQLIGAEEKIAGSVRERKILRDDFATCRATLEEKEKELAQVQKKTAAERQMLEAQIKELNVRIAELEQQLAGVKPQVDASLSRSLVPDEPRPEVGKPYRFGPYQWRVLEVRKDRALLLSEDILEKRSYHTSYTATTWAECELHDYLNGTGSFQGKGFIDDKFSSQERSRILTTPNANPNNQWYGTKGGEPTQDKVFLLSIDEVVKYFGDSGQLKNRPRNAWWINDQYNTKRIAKDGSEAWWWWLRSPGYLGSVPRTSLMSAASTCAATMSVTLRAVFAPLYG